MNQKINQSKWTEDWINIQSITNGMIVLPNQDKVSGVKITPRNIFILDEDAQSNVLIALKNFYNTIDYEFWLVVADRPVDINLYISQLQLQLNDTQNPVYRKLLIDDISKAELFMNNGIVDTEYFILFKDKDTDSIQKKIRNLISNLANCGLIASQTSNEDLRMIIDNFLNGGIKFESGTVITNGN